MGKLRNQDNGTRQTNGPNENTAGSGGVRYSAENGTTKDASELSRSDLRYLLENAQNGVLPDNSYIPLRRNTPEFFMGVVAEHSRGSVVVENHPMVSTVRHIRQNMDEEDDQTYGRERPHGFEPDDIITISEKMGDPAYIVLQGNGRYAEVVTFYNKRNKRVVVAVDFADSISARPKNYKHTQYMNGYGGGYYNVVVTQYEPDSFARYLEDCEIVYNKKEMNGRYQVGSGRVVTITHDTPFIEDIITEQQPGVKEISAQDRSKEVAGDSEEWVSVFDLPFNEQMEAMAQGRYDNETKRVRLNKPAQADTQKANSQAVENPKQGKSKFSADDTQSENPYAGRSMTEDGGIYSYDFLTALRDMRVVSLPEVQALQDQDGRIDTRKVVDEGMKNARNVGTERDGKVFVRNDYTGNLLRIDNESIRHGLNGSYNRLLTNARLGAVIGNVVQNAVPINALYNKAQGVSGTYAMAGYATDIAGREFVAIVTVEQRDGNISGIEVYDVAHAVSGRQKNRSERVDTKSQGVYPSTNASEISIADFLNVVKSTHQSILSEDVLDSLGERRNPGGFYTGKVRYSADDTSAMEEELQMRESQQYQDRLMEDGGSAAWVANQKRIEVLRQQMKRDPETIFRCVVCTTVCVGTDSRKCRKFYGKFVDFSEKMRII